MCKKNQTNVILDWIIYNFASFKLTLDCLICDMWQAVKKTHKDDFGSCEDVN